MLNRQNISSSGRFEKLIGYSRVVKAGNLVFVSGTTGTDSNGRLVSNDSYAQARQTIQNIKSALEKTGGTLTNVVRTRVFLSHNADWRSVARAHEEAFGSILPASSMLVCNFLDPDILVEIEADAILDA